MEQRSVSNLIIYIFICSLATALTNAATLPVQSFQQDESGVTIELSFGTLRLEVCDERTIHVTCSPTDKLTDEKDIVVIRQWTPVPFEWREEPSQLILRSKNMGVKVNRATGRLTFIDSTGKILLEEPNNGGRSIEEIKSSTTNTVGQEKFYRIQQTFLSPTDEYLYGMAQCQDGIWNWRGMPIELRQVNTQAALPMLISSRGYGLLWNNASLTDFNPVDYEISLTSSSAAQSNGPTATEQLRGRGSRGRGQRGAASVRTGTFITGEAGEYVFFVKDGDRRCPTRQWEQFHFLLIAPAPCGFLVVEGMQSFSPDRWAIQPHFVRK